MTEIEDLMLDAVRLILEIPDDNASVRLAYGANSPTGSAPAHNIKDSVCYIAVSLTDDGYGKQHHISYANGEPGELLTEIDEYTEEYAVIFSCYGGDAYERARTIRDGLYGNAAKRHFHARYVHFVVGSPQLIQTREVINGAWVRRCDFTATFYAYTRVERTDAVDWFDRANITFKTSQPN
jgi:hypothetical protein